MESQTLKENKDFRSLHPRLKLNVVDNLCATCSECIFIYIAHNTHYITYAYLV